MKKKIVNVGGIAETYLKTEDPKILIFYFHLVDIKNLHTFFVFITYW